MIKEMFSPLHNGPHTPPQASIQPWKEIDNAPCPHSGAIDSYWIFLAVVALCFSLLYVMVET